MRKSTGLRESDARSTGCRKRGSERRDRSDQHVGRGGGFRSGATCDTMPSRSAGLAMPSRFPRRAAVGGRAYTPSRKAGVSGGCGYRPNPPAGEWVAAHSRLGQGSPKRAVARWVVAQSGLRFRVQSADDAARLQIGIRPKRFSATKPFGLPLWQSGRLFAYRNHEVSCGNVRQVIAIKKHSVAR